MGGESALEEGMATRSSVLAWRISRTEEPGGLQSTGSHRLRHELTVVLQGTGSRKLLLRGPLLAALPPGTGSITCRRSRRSAQHR